MRSAKRPASRAAAGGAGGRGLRRARKVVAVGAGIQGAVLAGERRDVLLLDVTPLTLGIETEHGIMTPLVERNTTIPTEKKQTFSTAADNQTAVTVKVFQGERRMAVDNRLLGEFNLEGLPPAPRGMPKIEVKFDIDQNGILNVSAKDLGTGKAASVRIEQSSGLDDNEIERMRKDAESHAEEDKRKVELAEACNQADQMCYSLEKLMKDNEVKLSDGDKEPLKKAIEKVRDAVKTNDTPTIKSAVRDLEQASHALSKVLYEKAAPEQAEGAGPQAGGEARPNDDAIDAEFEVKK